MTDKDSRVALEYEITELTCDGNSILIKSFDGNEDELWDLVRKSDEYKQASKWAFTVTTPQYRVECPKKHHRGEYSWLSPGIFKKINHVPNKPSYIVYSKEKCEWHIKNDVYELFEPVYKSIKWKSSVTLPIVDAWKGAEDEDEKAIISPLFSKSIKNKKTCKQCKTKTSYNTLSYGTLKSVENSMSNNVPLFKIIPPCRTCYPNNAGLRLFMNKNVINPEIEEFIEKMSEKIVSKNEAKIIADRIVYRAKRKFRDLQT